LEIPIQVQSLGDSAPNAVTMNHKLLKFFIGDSDPNAVIWRFRFKCSVDTPIEVMDSCFGDHCDSKESSYAISTGVNSGAPHPTRNRGGFSRQATFPGWQPTEPCWFDLVRMKQEGTSIFQKPSKIVNTFFKKKYLVPKVFLQ